jgi:cell division protein FtsW (lipid II flippase)
MNKISYYLVLLVGIVTCLQFIPHAFMGFPAVLEHIKKGEINGDATLGMQIIWLYSSIMMLLSGVWMLYLAKPIKNGNHVARMQGLLLSLGLLAFGVCHSYITKEVFNHLFFFTVEGILLLLAVTIFFRQENHAKG